jgi:hypothetical protein
LGRTSVFTGNGEPGPRRMLCLPSSTGLTQRPHRRGAHSSRGRLPRTRTPRARRTRCASRWYAPSKYGYRPNAFSPPTRKARVGALSEPGVRYAAALP